MPGSPKTSVAPRTENESGFPGRIATPQNTSSAPSSATVRRTRSCGPTETPPEVTTTSAASARSSATRCASSSSATPSRALDDRARALEEACEHDAVRLVDLAGGELLAGRAELGSRRDDRDPRPASAARLRHPGRRERGEPRRGEQRCPPRGRARPRRRRRPAGGRSPRRARASSTRTTSPSTVTCSIGTTASAPVRHDATGRDRHRLAAPRAPAPRARPPRLAADDRQLTRRVLGAEREAVHRGAREAWEVDRREGVLREHAPGGLGERDGLRLERLHPFEHAGERVLDGQEAGHGVDGTHGVRSPGDLGRRADARRGAHGRAAVRGARERARRTGRAVGGDLRRRRLARRNGGRARAAPRGDGERQGRAPAPQRRQGRRARRRLPGGGGRDGRHDRRRPAGRPGGDPTPPRRPRRGLRPRHGLEDPPVGSGRAQAFSRASSTPSRAGSRASACTT